MTLGESPTHIGFLENIIQLGCLYTSTSFSPSLFVELGMEHIENQDGF